MDDPKLLERMRADWNERAAEDANYYVAFGRREQDTEEFFSTASDVLKNFTGEWKRLRARDAALEIGCGPGRLMKPLSAHFDEIHGVDVSDRMITLARERLRDVPNAHPHHGSGSDLAMFPDSKFDFVYSYAVFQHIPSREVVFEYLREARRVLKPGGILRCQVNGLPPHARQYDTWSGVRIGADEVREFARQQDFQLLALEQVWTQYMWITCRKPAAARQEGAAPVLRSISNAFTGDAVAPTAGAPAALALWVDRLPAGCDLNSLVVTADGLPCRLMYIGEPDAAGVSQVNAALPEGIRTGLVPVEMEWSGAALCAGRWVRIMPAAPAVPRIHGVTDGVNLLSGARIVSGTVKVTMIDVTHPEDFRATVDGREVRETDSFCTDPLDHRYEFNFLLPEATPPGWHHVRISLGRREFPPLPIEVV
jgi:SAM-dependent methyltransferase